MKHNSFPKVDELDRRIIRLLQRDSRKSFNNIAKNLGISIGTAFNRVKNLEHKGILKGYTIVLDPTKLDYGLTALILIQADGQAVPKIEEHLAQLDEVIIIYDITGDYDIAVVARFKNRNMLSNFIKLNLRRPHIIKSVTSMVLNVMKEDFGVNV